MSRQSSSADASTTLGSFWVILLLGGSSLGEDGTLSQKDQRPIAPIWGHTVSFLLKICRDLGLRSEQRLASDNKQAGKQLEPWSTIELSERIRVNGYHFKAMLRNEAMQTNKECRALKIGCDFYRTHLTDRHNVSGTDKNITL